MFYRPHLTDLIERTLKEYGLHSEEAVTLVYGTIQHESTFGAETCLRQRTSNYKLKVHALGILQMEYNTYLWLCGKYGDKYSFALKDFERLEYDLKFAILLCRLRYRAVPSPLPKDIKGMSKYYKKYYNSSAGAATPQDFIDAVS
jgi:hypothetical protein